MKKQVIATVLALLGTQAVFAQATPRVDRREARQEQRIEQGAASGQLTPKEAARLEKQQDRIEASEAQAKSDGKVTAKERARLTAQQNKASRKIRHNKHDRQKA